MTVKEIALSAAALLQADDIEEILSGEDAETDADVKSLARCVALAASELCGCGFAVDVSETCAAENGVIPFSALSRTPLKIVRASRNGGIVAFGTNGVGITVPRDGEYEVTYLPAPTVCALDDKLPLSALCEPETVACLTARNYCLMTGRTDDASVWDQLYAARAENIRMARRATLPRRRWIG